MHGSLVHNLDKMITPEIQRLIDRYNWYLKYNIDDDDEADKIYIQADKLASKYKIDKEEFWFIYFT